MIQLVDVTEKVSKRYKYMGIIAKKGVTKLMIIFLGILIATAIIYFFGEDVLFIKYDEYYYVNIKDYNQAIDSIKNVEKKSIHDSILTQKTLELRNYRTKKNEDFFFTYLVVSTILFFILMTIIILDTYSYFIKEIRIGKHHYFLSVIPKDDEKVDYEDHYIKRYTTLFQLYLQHYGIEIETLSESEQPNWVQKLAKNVIQIYTIPKKYPFETIQKHWDKYISFLEEDLRYVSLDKKTDSEEQTNTEILESEIKGLVNLIRGGFHIEEILEIAQAFRFGVQQYLLLFKDYIKTTQQHDLVVEAVEHPNGLLLRIRLEENQPVGEVRVWLNEYMDILKQNTDKLEIKTSPKTNPKDFDILILKLENQIAHLKNSIRIAEMENESLRTQRDFLQKLSMAFAQKEEKIIINSSQITGEQNTTVQHLKDSNLDIG